MESAYVKNLILTVIKSSEATTWEDAVLILDILFYNLPAHISHIKTIQMPGMLTLRTQASFANKTIYYVQKYLVMSKNV